MKIRYFTKEQLFQAAVVAVERDYNRQIDPSWVTTHIDEGVSMPVVFHMIHEHRAGVPIEPHIRAMITINEDGDRVMLDVDWKMFYKLSEAEIPERKATDAYVGTPQYHDVD